MHHPARKPKRSPTRGSKRAIVVLLLISAIGCSTPPLGSDTTPPVLSDGRPSGTLSAGTTQATLSVKTDEQASCGYSEEANQPYPEAAALSPDPSGTAHTAVVTGLQNGGSYAFYVRCADLAGNATTTDFAISFSVATSGGGDTPPTLSNGQPRGALPAGTTETTLSVQTDEAATCRYSDQAGVAFGNMPNAFATTGGTSHSTSRSGLANGQSYRFYVRCQDAAGNANPADFVISFSVNNSGGGGAISATVLASGSGQDMSSVITSSITPAPNALLLVWVANTTGATTPNVPTVTGNGMTWELVETRVRNGGGPRRVSVLRALSPSPAAGSVTINLGEFAEEVLWAVVEHTGVTTTGSNGSGAIAQSASAEAGGTETSALVTLGASSGTMTATTGGIFAGAGSDMVPGAGFVELTEDAVGMSSTGQFRLLTEFQSQFDATVDASWNGGAHWVAIGIELR